MSFFTSYAQNCEDVLLWRALGHIEQGFYIDVGANDTEEHSVTKAFYERGWHGINIEPLPLYHARFVEQRPRDINLLLAAGSERGEIPLYDVEGIHGWATLDPQIAQQHRDEGHAIVESRTQVLPLTAICAEHVSGPVHFLKIDVEGFEEQVLRGMDFARWRPWILVIEATLPNSQITNHAQWEHLVLQQQYQFAYFDGLNRYYVAAEQAHLAQKLQLQPNVFDNFHSVHLVRAWEQRDAAEQAQQQQLQRANEFQELEWKTRVRGEQLQAEHAQMQQQRDEARQQQGATLAALHHAQQEWSNVCQQLSLLQAEQQKTMLGWQQAQQAQIDAQQARMQAMLEAKQARLEMQQTQIEARNQQRQAEIVADEALEHADQARTLAHTLQQKEQAAQEQAAHAMQQLQALQAHTNEVQAWAHNVDQAARNLEAMIAGMHASSSWRVTQPLRSISHWKQVALNNGPLLPRLWASSKRVLRTQAAKVVRKLVAHEGLRQMLIPRLMRFPALDARLTHAVNQLKAEQVAAPEPSAQHLPPPLRQLPLEARKIFADMQRARQSQ